MISAHKWLFQPKGSLIILFREPARAEATISFGGSYLATANPGILESHGAVAVPLLATLMAWGRNGVCARIEHCMALANELAARIAQSSAFDLFCTPETGVVVFRPRAGGADSFAEHVGTSTVSKVMIERVSWVRCVASNPMTDVDAIFGRLCSAACLPNAINTPSC